MRRRLLNLATTPLRLPCVAVLRYTQKSFFCVPYLMPATTAAIGTIT
jgi:hypothetical protein